MANSSIGPFVQPPPRLGRGPSAVQGILDIVFVVTLICSDPDCEAYFEAWASTAGELFALACDCGCGLEAVHLPDPVTDADARQGPVELAALGPTPTPVLA